MFTKNRPSFPSEIKTSVSVQTEKNRDMELPKSTPNTKAPSGQIQNVSPPKVATFDEKG